jgi:hypothetical protein
MKIFISYASINGFQATEEASSSLKKTTGISELEFYNFFLLVICIFHPGAGYSDSIVSASSPDLKHCMPIMCAVEAKDHHPPPHRSFLIFSISCKSSSIDSVKRDGLKESCSSFLLPYDKHSEKFCKSNSKKRVKVP